MTKKEIVKTISEEIGMTQLVTKEIVQKTFDAIIETLVAEGRIELRNFGVFEVKKRKSRKARNPKTGDPVEVSEKFVVTFKPGKEMEERVRQHGAVAPPEAGSAAPPEVRSVAPREAGSAADGQLRPLTRSADGTLNAPSLGGDPQRDGRPASPTADSSSQAERDGSYTPPQEPSAVERRAESAYSGFRASS